MGNLTLIIGNKNYSSWSLRPWLWMKQSGIAFTEKRISLEREVMAAELAPYFSNDKVPLLLDAGEQIWDSLAIMEYLAEEHPQHAWPEERLARAMARSVSAEMHSSFMAMRESMPMNCSKQFIGCEFGDDVIQDIRRIEALWNSCRQQHGQGGPWLFGKFSIADAIYAPVAVRFWCYRIELEGEAKAYLESILESRYLRQWMAEGRAESETLDWDEIDPSICSEVIEVQ